MDDETAAINALEVIKFARREWREEQARHQQRDEELRRMESDAAVKLNHYVRGFARYKIGESYVILHDETWLRVRIANVIARVFAIRINEGAGMVEDDTWGDIIYVLHAHDGAVYYRPFTLTEADLKREIELYEERGKYVSLPIEIGGDKTVYKKHVKTEAMPGLK